MRSMLIVVTLACLVVGGYVLFESERNAFDARMLKAHSATLDAYQLKWWEIESAINPKASCDDEVTFLDLIHSSLSKLPVEIERLTNLTQLVIRPDQLNELSSEFAKLANVKEICVFTDQITHLPSEIGNFTSLTKLSLTGLSLTELPVEIGKLGNLEILRLNYNRIEKLPREIGELAELTELDLADNPIVDADLEHLKPLVKLRVLYIQSTNVTKEGVASLQTSLPNCKILASFPINE
jgi:Leucine-rich repeat (LRR) protein